MTMFFQPEALCPGCQGAHCRKSRWLSPEEKRLHPGCLPYRCNDCSLRFLHRTAKGLRLGWLYVGLAVLLLLIVTAIGMWQMDRSGSAADQSPVSAAEDPVVLQAAQNGDPLAQFRLGEALFLDPLRNDQTSAQAVRWLELAAQGGNVDAMILLGRLSRTGVGILQNFAQASKWIHTAAQRGSDEGMLEMGRLYRDGVGVDKDLIRAYAWFNRAAAARNLDAVREREAVARILTADELREAQRLSSQKLHNASVD